MWYRSSPNSLRTHLSTLDAATKSHDSHMCVSNMRWAGPHEAYLPHSPEEEVSKVLVCECSPQQEACQWAVMAPLELKGLEGRTAVASTG